MAEVLIIYGTSEGHTALVVDRLRTPLEAAGHLVRGCSVDDAPTCPIGYDLVLVGSSVHRGHHHRGVTRWVKGNAEFLNRMPSAFFEVSRSSGGGPLAANDGQRSVDDLRHATGWRPDLYRAYDDTDYEAVAQFADDVRAMLDRTPHAASA
jgi:menaquinone-dependent protoporphyrinogen oxidase